MTQPPGPRTDPPLDELPRPLSRRALWWEIALVLALTLGLSGLRSLVNLIDAALRPAPIASQTVSIVVPLATNSWLDLAAQLISVLGAVAWGMLGLYLLWRSGIDLRTRLGLTPRWWDLVPAVLLAAGVGAAGLALYFVSYSLGFSLDVQAAPLDDTWWRVPVLVLRAMENGVSEEFLVVGYLVTRLQQLRLPVWGIVAASALLRGSYHLYQGFPMALGNVAMGVLFAVVFLQWKRLWPLVIAHTIMDTAVFIGQPLLQAAGIL